MAMIQVSPITQEPKKSKLETWLNVMGLGAELGKMGTDIYRARQGK